LIAQTPVEPRDASRLLVLHRSDGRIEHCHFRDIITYLHPGDLLVANESRVIPARLFAHKLPSGGKVEILLLSKRSDETWEVLLKPGRRVKPGTRLAIDPAHDGTEADRCGRKDSDQVLAEVVGVTKAGGRVLRCSVPIEPLLDQFVILPLPPYIHTPLARPERYQTIYARVKGSVAAPTAGLHFTPQLLQRLQEQGVEFAFVTLHVSMDTFRPVQEENIEEHRMYSEYCELPVGTCAAINRARAEGRRVIAVGTTTVRVLESAALATSRSNSRARKTAGQTSTEETRACLAEGEAALATSCSNSRARKAAGHTSTEETQACLAEGEAALRLGAGESALHPFAGPTDLFIHPDFSFHVVQAMITNFHLPRSTLLMLVAAFAGKDLIHHAYQEAIHQRYRFYSFGDAMLIL